jgi:endonuclease/exonuclease/phosphatase family metal-dependent hydrolase
MPPITDPPPAEVVAERNQLRQALDRDVPAKVLDYNLLVATWNLRAFGDLTTKWEAGPRDTPKRDLHSLLCIAEIVSRFDVVALQEVRANVKALRHLLKYLGSNWGLILTDVTKGDSGNGERLAFLFDTRKVQLSGLACELVVPQEQLEEGRISPDALDRQFARTPYAVAFRSGSQTFILVTLHVLYGNRSAQRIPELRAIAQWMADWARNVHAWHHNFIVLGDFNIDRRGDQLYEAFTSTGLYVPGDLHLVPRTIFADPAKPEEKFYDQIAWFIEDNGLPALDLRYYQGGSFDFVPLTLQSRNLTRSQLSWRVSDHYPLWAEFKMRGH